MARLTPAADARVARREPAIRAAAARRFPGCARCGRWHAVGSRPVVAELAVAAGEWNEQGIGGRDASGERQRDDDGDDASHGARLIRDRRPIYAPCINYQSTSHRPLRKH
jgi:hypothetical protein